MARYDVFLASALADREKAELIVRRLRALKFKVRYDKKREHTTPTPKDYRDANNAGSVLILWSRNACDTSLPDSDWVHAIAHHARSKPGVLLQAALDASIPDEPFRDDPRFALSGMGPRKLVEGYYQLVGELGNRDGRTGLHDWLALKASDADGKAAWQAAHPEDPLSQTRKPKPTPAATAPTPAPEPVAAEQQVIPPRTTAKLNPPLITPADEYTLGRIMLLSVGLVIVCMLLMSALMRSQPLPAIANASLAEQCPAGQVPDYLLETPTRPVLEPGPIIDDTEDE